MTTGTKATKVLSYQEYLVEPETMLRFDIVDGAVIMAERPTRWHQTIAGNIYWPAWGLISERGLGEMWFAPLDVVVQRDPLRVRQPDLLYVSAENSGILTARVEGGPDWVVEILSRGNRRRELAGKLADYAAIGVRECWVVSQRDFTVEVLALDNGGWRRVGVRGMGERVESVVVSGFGMAVGDVFLGV